MKKIGILWLVLGALLGATLAWSAEESLQQQRFSSWANILHGKLTSSRSYSRVADALVSGPARIAAFNLQALGKLYEKEDAGFKKIRFDFKEIEDAIGDYKKWNDIYKANDGGVSQRVINKRAKAKKALVKMLKADKWVVRRGSSKLKKHLKFLAEYDFGSYGDDKAVALEALLRQLSKVGERDYDLSKLEEGNGLHELRREIRWFALEAGALNGLVTFREDINDCPSEYYAPLVEDRRLMGNKYAVLKRNPEETNACEISRCLFLGVTDLIGKFGKLKDQVEEMSEGVGDDVPEDIQIEAEEYYDEMIEYELTGYLREQLRECI